MFIYRVLSTAILIPVVGWMVYEGGPWFLVTVAIFTALASYEFFALMVRGGYHPSFAPGMVLAQLLVLDAQYPGWHIGRLAVTAMIVVSLAWQLFRHTAAPTVDWALTVAGGLYLGWLMSHLVSLRQGLGAGWVWMALLLTWAYDTGAYLIGMRFGRHKLWPRHSPRKSWEGAAGGTLCAVVTALIVGHFLAVAPLQSIALGLLASVVAPFGDLAVSMFKRQVGVKDTGHLIPGHGGVLDRIDSILFVAPVVYYYAVWIVGA